MAARMNAALASKGPSAALRCFMEDLEEFELLEGVAKARVCRRLRPEMRH